MEIKKYMIRGHLTLSTDMSAEEMRQAIADFWGTSLSNIPPINKEVFLQQVRNYSNAVTQKTAELKAKLSSIKNTNADKFIELDEVGRFIVKKDKAMQLIVPNVIPRIPDFLISYNNKVIGLEHTRLVIQNMANSFKTIKYCLKKAQSLLSQELNHLSKTVNISIDYDKLIFGNKRFAKGGLSRNEKEQVWTTIAKFVGTLLTGGEIKMPDFVSKYTGTSNKDSRVDIEISETFLTEANIAPALLERIADKESKADDYRNEINADLFVLLIVLDDLNSISGFDLQEAELPLIAESKFDSIFLFEKQSGTIKTIYSNNSIL